MINPLSGNPGHVQHLCSLLALGTPAGMPSTVRGGFHHRVWRLETDLGTYAVKQLSVDADVDDRVARSHYNTSEGIAEAFAVRGVPAIFALKSGAEYLQIIDGERYLVHPWSTAAALDISDVSERHALEVAGLLARMHGMSLEFPGLRQQEFDVHPEENIVLLVDMARDLHVERSGMLRRGLPSFLEIANAQRSAIRILENHLVISHGDLDQKNVLWDADGKPALIDWESARKLNPTHEIITEALNWSGIGSHFDPDLFEKIVSGYKQAGGVIEHDSVTAAYHCILGDWLNWLMYNVGRCLDLKDIDQRATGAKQIEFAVAALQRIMDYVPDLLSVSNPRAAETSDRQLADV